MLVQGLKQKIRVEGLKALVDMFDECASVALSIESAIWRVVKASSFERKDDSC